MSFIGSRGSNTSTQPEAEPNVRPYMPEADPSQQPIFTNHIVWCEGGSSMYLRGKMFGREVYGLLDSGSSRSVVPQMYLPSNAQIKRSSCVLYAVNHTELRVIGEVDFDFEVEGRKLWVRAVVTTDTSSILLGSDFMQVHDVTMKWSNQGPKARIDGAWVSLDSLPDSSVNHVRVLSLSQPVLSASVDETLFNLDDLFSEDSFDDGVKDVSVFRSVLWLLILSMKLR